MRAPRGESLQQQAAVSVAGEICRSDEMNAIPPVRFGSPLAFGRRRRRILFESEEVDAVAPLKY
jgi:hypothetical protein